MDEEHVQAVTDEALAREIERAARVDPSPAFLAGVRARIAEEPPPWWRFHHISWALVTACALIAALTVMLQRVEFSSKPDASMDPLVSHARTADTPVALRAAVDSRAAVLPATVKRQPRAEVVISRDEAEAIRHLLNGGALTIATVVESAVSEASPVPGTADIVIPPIAIDLLESTKATEGAKP